MARRALPMALGIAAVLSASTLGALWLRSGDAPTDTRRAESGRAAAPSAATAATVQAAAAVEDAITNVEPAPRATGDERLVALVPKMAEFGYKAVGHTFVDYLTGRGLARADGERVVHEAMREITACSLEALRAQAAAQSVPFDAVLDALERDDFYFVYRPEIAALIDVEPVRAQEEACSLNVRQQMGLPSGPTGLTTRNSTSPD